MATMAFVELVPGEWVQTLYICMSLGDHPLSSTLLNNFQILMRVDESSQSTRCTIQMTTNLADDNDNQARRKLLLFLNPESPIKVIPQ
jgi:hypothetical protein